MQLCGRLQKADSNGDGRLSVDEYYRILRDHGVDCSREEILAIMQVADKDHDGFISREEFLVRANGWVYENSLFCFFLKK